MADQGKNDQKFIFAIAMRSAQAGGWPAASSGEGDSSQAPMVRQEREEPCGVLSHHLERTGDMAGPLAQANAQRLTTAPAVCSVYTDEERGPDP